jgi:hypothetical protein
MANNHHLSKPKMWVYAVATALSFLIMAWVVRTMYQEHNPGRVNSQRAAERIKARNEVEAAAVAEMNNAGDVDAQRGIKRIPIQQAMEMLVRDWENPAAGRSNLLVRLEKATAPLPEAPVQPSEFE